jgi:hypothetical protein
MDDDTTPDIPEACATLQAALKRADAAIARLTAVLQGLIDLEHHTTPPPPQDEA